MENEENKTDWVAKWHHAEEKCYEIEQQINKHRKIISILLEKIEQLEKKLEEYE